MSERPKELTRKNFLIATGTAVGGAGLYYLGKKAGEAYTEYLLGPSVTEEIPPTSTEVPTKKPTKAPESTPTRQPREDGFEYFDREFIMPQLEFSEIREPKQLFSSEWNQTRFLQEWQEKIATAEKTGEVAEIELPAGEILITQKMSLGVPRGVELVIRGNKNGSRLKLTEELSLLPNATDERERSWLGHEFNLMEVKLGQEAKLTIEDLEWDGGSTRAGRGDYEAPVGPWNTILGIYGDGSGSGNMPAKDAAGEVKVRNCLFRNSEAPGLVVQNLNQAVIENCSGKDLDTLVTANWNRQTRIANCRAKNSLSDAFFVVDCQDVEIKNCSADVSRQGFNIHGSEGVLLENCQGRQCAEFITISRADADLKRSRGVLVLDCHSAECNFVYAIQYVDNVQIIGGRHDQAGEWWLKEDFLHTGIANYSDLGRAPLWVNFRETNGLEFLDVEIRKGTKAPNDYRVDKRPTGVSFIAPPENS